MISIDIIVFNVMYRKQSYGYQAVLVVMSDCHKLSYLCVMHCHILIKACQKSINSMHDFLL